MTYAPSNDLGQVLYEALGAAQEKEPVFGGKREPILEKPWAKTRRKTAFRAAADAARFADSPEDAGMAACRAFSTADNREPPPPVEHIHGYVLRCWDSAAAAVREAAGEVKE